MPHSIVFPCQNEEVRSGNYPAHLKLRCFCRFYIWLCNISLSEAEFATFPREYPVYKVLFLWNVVLVVTGGSPFPTPPPTGSPSLFPPGLYLPSFLCCLGRGRWVCICGLCLAPSPLAAVCRDHKLWLSATWPMGLPHPSPSRDPATSEVAVTSLVNRLIQRFIIRKPLFFPKPSLVL